MTEPVVMTRHSREAELKQKGVTGEALECLLAETAQERHLSRVACARWAAEEYYLAAARLDRDEVSQDTLALMAGAILWADVIGIGGRDNVEGAATARHPAFVACGKGRKQATDGGAWTAAIHRAALDCAGVFRLNGNDVLVYSRAHRDAPPNETLVDEVTTPAQWVYSILREGLRRAAGLHGWHSEVPFDVNVEGDSGRWAKFVNEAAPVEPAVRVRAY